MLFLTELRIELTSTGIIFLSLELKCDSYFNLCNGNFKSSHLINLAGNRIHQMLTLYLVLISIQTFIIIILSNIVNSHIFIFSNEQVECFY